MKAKSKVHYVGGEPWITLTNNEDGTVTATYHRIKPLGAEDDKNLAQKDDDGPKYVGRDNETGLPVVEYEP